MTSIRTRVFTFSWSTNGRYRLSVSEDEIRLLNLAGAVSAFFE